jgi:DnaK suppressor protein
MKNTKHRAAQPVVYDRVWFRLEQEQRDLQRRLERTKRQLLNADAGRSSPPEAGDLEQETLIERSSHYRERLKLVIQSLQRLREGTFGLCEICEEPIGHKRLEALPTARYCISCQEQIEQAARQGGNTTDNAYL